MSLSIQQIFEEKFRDIQSRLPIKMNTAKTPAVSFDEVLSNQIASGSNSAASNSVPKSLWMPAIESAISAASAKYNIDPNIIRAIVKAESGFNPNATSKAGAQGLMQLMPATAKGLGVTNSFDIQQNVDGGTKYIKQKLEQFGDIKLALAAYNAGPGSVKKYNGVPPYPETQNYVKTVLKYYDEYTNKK